MSGLLGYAKKAGRALEAYGKNVVTGKYARQGLIDFNAQLKAAEAGDPKAALNLVLRSAPFGTIDAWHGSPYEVEAFDPSKIGTGEGNAAYGHGFYSAGHPKVAQTYAPPNPETLKAPELAALFKAIHGADAADQLEYQAPGWQNSDEGMRAAQMLRNNESLPPAPNGNVYKVQLAPNEEDLLDWDKPLSGQSQKVQGIMQDLAPGVGDDLTGEDLYGMLGPPEAASQALQSAGVPGIKYLDGISRVAGQGTSNYVMFDPGNIKILGKQ